MTATGVSTHATEDEVEYSFAMEYDGPPVPYELPRAVPINIEQIPTAVAVSHTSLPDELPLPIVQPLLATDPLSIKFSKELTLVSDVISDVIVSPTSVITFEPRDGDGHDCGLSHEFSSSDVLEYPNGHDNSFQLSNVVDISSALGLADGLECSSELLGRIGSSETLGFSNRPDEFEPRAGGGHDCGLSREFSSSDILEFPNGHDNSCQLSVVVDISGASGFSNDLECSSELLGRIESSETLGFSNSHDEANELSENSLASESSYDGKESVDFIHDMNLPEWGSPESVSSSLCLSSEVSSCKANDCYDLPPFQTNKASIVTFREDRSSDTVDEDSSKVGFEIIHEKKTEMKVRKGSCHRCSKGNWFTEKEACMVCNAKYCVNCVLRAMGSMPEGRKCVTCIGCPIDESKRASLGKCSRVLKRLLNELEIQQIMKTEKLCEANQLQPDCVYVNGRQLCQEELVLLQSCPNPPKKLKPGRYWYDKVSGFWGKDGQKPCKIISPNLNVGGQIMANASNGNTQVFLNGREITKIELRMLALAGVQCAGNPHFWLNADGSYQEEGQKNIKGHIWGKAGTKLLCAVLSLPVPSSEANPSESKLHNLGSGAVPDYLEQRTLQKLLLVGSNGSGTSTIFKQAKILYASFSEDERQNIKVIIQSKVYKYLGVLLEARERFEEESLTEIGKIRYLDHCSASGSASETDDKTIYSIGSRLKSFSDWLLKVMVSGNLEAIFPAATREYAPVVEELWRNPAIQATYNRRSELHMLPSVASYFLEQVVEILRLDYEPSDLDILYAEGITPSNGLACIEFSLAQSKHDTIASTEQHEYVLRYQLISVHARSLGENCKWLEMFEDVRIVIFCVALSDYDELCDDGSGVAMNKMLASRKLFETIITHPSFDQMDFLLILNKFDILEEKIERIPLSQCDWFDDFNPVLSRRCLNKINSINSSPSLAHQAYHHIAVKFKRLFSSITGRKLYVTQMNALERGTVEEALRYTREIIKWEEERANFSISEYSFFSTDEALSITDV